MAPEQIMLVIIWLALTLYTLLGGADFGAGIWEVNAALQTSEKERSLLYRAIAPVWEANHVWLIFVLVCLYTAFPPAFAVLSRALWLPLLLALVGIVFRGAAFAFRSQASGAKLQRSLWHAVFALSSAVAPFFLGAAAGAVASGHIAVDERGQFAGNYLTGWLCPLAIFNGFFTVGICAYLAAVYLTRESSQAGESELVELWRQRALATGLWMGVLSLAGLALLWSEPAALWTGLWLHAWPLVLLSLAAGIFSLWALWRRHFAFAVLGAAITVIGVLWGWAAGQYPALVPPRLTVGNAHAPASVLRAALVGIACGTVLLLPALLWLLAIFKLSRTPRQAAC